MTTRRSSIDGMKKDIASTIKSVRISTLAYKRVIPRRGHTINSYEEIDFETPRRKRISNSKTRRPASVRQFTGTTLENRMKRTPKYPPYYYHYTTGSNGEIVNIYLPRQLTQTQRTALPKNVLNEIFNKKVPSKYAYSNITFRN